jgi:hypothetical protein
MLKGQCVKAVIFAQIADIAHFIGLLPYYRLDFKHTVKVIIS